MLSAVLANTKLISECIENTLGEILRAQRIGMSEGFCEKQSQTETLGFSETILTPSGGIWDCYIESSIQFRTTSHIQMNSHTVRFLIFLLSLIDVLNVFLCFIAESL